MGILQLEPNMKVRTITRIVENTYEHMVKFGGLSSVRGR
jgi:hypothetical protein